MIDIVLKYSPNKDHSVHDSKARIVPITVSYDTVNGMLAAARSLFCSESTMDTYILCCIQQSLNQEDIAVSHDPEHWITLDQLEQYLYRFGYKSSSGSCCDPWNMCEFKQVPSYKYILTTSNGGQYYFSNSTFLEGFKLIMSQFGLVSDDYIAYICDDPYYTSDSMTYVMKYNM